MIARLHLSVVMGGGRGIAKSAVVQLSASMEGSGMIVRNVVGPVFVNMGEEGEIAKSA